MVSIVDEMFEGFQVIDREGRYLYVNKSAAEQGKHTPDELIGKKMEEMYPGIEETQMYRQLMKVGETGQGSEMLNKFTFPDQTTGWFRLIFEPIEVGVLILSIDVTDLKTKEIELEKKNKEMEHTLSLLIGRKSTMPEIKEELQRILDQSQNN
jgi:PAS domain S-box-containing protein